MRGRWPSGGRPPAVARASVAARCRLAALQATDQLFEEHLVKAQLAGNRRLLEQRRGDLEELHLVLGLDRGIAPRAFREGRFAEAAAGLDAADDAAATADTHAARDHDVEAIVRVSRTQHRLAGLTLEPGGGAHHLADFRVREVVEETQLAQYGEAFLFVDL